MSERRESDQQTPSLIRRGWFQGIVIALLLTGAAIVALYFSIVPLLNNWLPPLLDRLVAPGSHLQTASQSEPASVNQLACPRLAVSQSQPVSQTEPVSGS